MTNLLSFCNSKAVYRQLSILVFFIVSFLMVATNSSAASLNAQSCSLEDVQAAINASTTGDVVVVPAGTCTWGSSVKIPYSKKLTLLGAGIGATVINKSPSGVAIYLSQSGSRLSGFTINEGHVVVDGDGWRVDHSKFSRATSFGEGVHVRGVRSTAAHPTGLVDNCIFINSRVLVEGTAAQLAENDWQHMLWTTSLGLGTNQDVVYVEDNTFEFTVFANAMDTNCGGAYVFRFNNVSGGYIECHSVQGNNRATRRWEIYGNLIDNPGSHIYYPYRLRGGTGVAFNNLLAGNWTNYAIAFDNVRSYDTVGDGGLCNGESAWDGNENSTGYPCRDQIGRGPDSPQWDHDPPGTYTQPLVPAYLWYNRRESNNALTHVNVINNSSNHIKANRDYYEQGSTFDGTSGVGVGLLAARPSLCTPGVAYWATDQGNWNKSAGGAQGVLYKCTAPNTWSLYYTPYEYPHPLSSGADNNPSPPTTPYTPTNARIIQ